MTNIHLHTRGRLSHHASAALAAGILGYITRKDYIKTKLVKILFGIVSKSVALKHIKENHGMFRRTYQRPIQSFKMKGIYRGILTKS